MSPDEMVKRLDRFEALLTDATKDMRDICVLVKNHDDKILDIRRDIIKLEVAQEAQRETCMAQKMSCPAGDVAAVKRWLWVTIGAVITAIIVAWAKVETAIKSIGGNQ